MRNLVLIALVILISETVLAANHSVPRFELNGIIGSSAIRPDSVNRKIQDANQSGISPRLSDITALSVAGIEALFGVGTRWQVGPRYMITWASSGKGTQAGQEAEIAIRVDDISMAGKYQLFRGNLASFSVGGTFGISTQYKVFNRTLSLPNGEFTASNVPIARGFIASNLYIWRFNLLGEVGYQYMKASEVKNSAGAALTSSSGTVDGNFSGIYFFGGLGVNF